MKNKKVLLLICMLLLMHIKNTVAQSIYFQRQGAIWICNSNTNNQKIAVKSAMFSNWNGPDISVHNDCKDNFPFSKCVVFGFVGEVIGSGAGFITGIMVPDSRKESDGSDGFGELNVVANNGLIGAGIGATIGCAVGVYKGGKQYRKHIFIPALAGAILIPAGVATYLVRNDKDHPSTQTAIFVVALTPIISTTFGYLLSNKKPQ